MPSSCFYPCPMVPVLCLGDMIYIHQINNDICLLGDPRLLKMFAAQFIFIFGLCITRINSCVIFEMYKGKCEGPIYYQQYGPTETGLNLVNCAQWCLGADICKSIVWEQGVCAEVGLAGTGERVTGNVFTPKRPILLPGEFEWMHEIRSYLLQSLLHMLWILLWYVLVELTSLFWLLSHILEPLHW